MQEQFTEAAANVYAAVFRILFWGMIASTALYAAGVAVSLWHPTAISMGAAPVESWTAMFAGVARLHAGSLMQMATVVLILTPVARVMMSLLAFWRDHDYKFVAVTAIVLAVIGLTVVLGRLGLH